MITQGTLLSVPTAPLRLGSCNSELVQVPLASLYVGWYPWRVLSSATLVDGVPKGRDTLARVLLNVDEEG